MALWSFQTINECKNQSFRNTWFYLFCSKCHLLWIGYLNCDVEKTKLYINSKVQKYSGLISKWRVNHWNSCSMWPAIPINERKHYVIIFLVWSDSNSLLPQSHILDPTHHYIFSYQETWKILRFSSSGSFYWCYTIHLFFTCDRVVLKKHKREFDDGSTTF